MGALRAAVYEDVADAEMMGLPHHILFAPIPDDLSKYGFGFHITAEESKKMFLAGREIMKDPLKKLLEDLGTE